MREKNNLMMYSNKKKIIDDNRRNSNHGGKQYMDLHIKDFIGDYLQANDNQENYNGCNNRSNDENIDNPLMKDEAEDKTNKSSDEDENKLADIIDKLNYNSDLNLLIFRINKILGKSETGQININNLSFTLNASELDKFENIKKQKPNFNVRINYSLKD